MGNKPSHPNRRSNSYIGEQVAKQHVSNNRFSMKEDSAIVNERFKPVATPTDQELHNNFEISLPPLALDKLNIQQKHIRTDSSSSNKRKSLPTSLKIGTPTPKIDSPATEKFWFLLSTPPQNHSNTSIELSNNLEKPSSLSENDSTLSVYSTTGPKSSIFDEYISGITMDVISATSPAIDTEGISSKIDRKASPSSSAYQAISNYKNKKNSVIHQDKRIVSNNNSNSNNNTTTAPVQNLIPKHLDEEPVDFSQPLMTPRHIKDGSIGLSNSVDTSISQLKHLISDDFTESGSNSNNNNNTGKTNLSVQSSRELNPSSPSSENNNNNGGGGGGSNKFIPPLKLKQLSTNSSPIVGSAAAYPLTAHSVVSVYYTTTTVGAEPTPHHHHNANNANNNNNTDVSISTASSSTSRSTRSLPWFISPKSPTIESETCSTSNISPPNQLPSNNNQKRKSASRTSVSDIRGGDIDSLREQIRNFDQKFDDENSQTGGVDQEPPVKFWDEIEEEEQDRKRKSLNAIYENFEHLHNIDVVIPRGGSKLALSSFSSSTNTLNSYKRASLTVGSVICGGGNDQDFIRNAKRSSVNLSNIVLTDKNGEQTIITPEASGALFGRGDSSISTFDIASDVRTANNRSNRHSLRRSLTQSFNNKRKSATAFLNSKLFK